MREISVNAQAAGSTLAALIRSDGGGEPGGGGDQAPMAWSAARRLCTHGRVRVNGAVETDPARRLRAGDVVLVDPHAPAVRAPRPGALERDAIVYVDADVVVVDKPAGVLTVPFSAEDRHTLIERVQTLLRADGKRGPRSELGAVQRLDKDTTGVLVFARTLPAKRALQEQWRKHAVERRYLALVHGVLLNARTIETQLLEDRGDGLRGSYGVFRRPRGPVPADAQRALTHVRPIEQLGARATLIECTLETGRQHQIRIHVSELGHPVLGESVYIRDYQGARSDAPRPMLHAAVLGFTHPRSGERLRFERPAPSDFQRMLDGLRGA